MRIAAIALGFAALLVAPLTQSPANAMPLGSLDSAASNAGISVEQVAAVVRRGGYGPRGGYAGRTTVVGPRGGVARRTTVVGPRGGAVYRGGAVVGRPGYYGRPGGYYRGWARPGRYWWGPGAAIAAGAAIGFVAAGTAVAWAGQPPAPGMCWYYTDPSRTQGFWDACPQ